ncbi:hypothetical protein TTE0854 [Caldanaerobacter subterraneus subsp. tengcongensis MB4]|uniref:Uncharacterized protein n=1 Tax=Caldanaerobacter subterraneus subsp. tengcongensis (strain DSM 15242 / JCM 11007 / NBRC 100824 / MB4) TaxID=273068 RepID=Q8RBG5_CALS4|nr:hypothetical protein TTE0854 [Caldanaerobacter subterraneus subsp. tengcongensis MB4]
MTLSCVSRYLQNLFILFILHFRYLLFILIIRGKFLNLHSVFYQEVLIFSKSILPYFLFITGMLYISFILKRMHFYPRGYPSIYLVTQTVQNCAVWAAGVFVVRPSDFPSPSRRYLGKP